MKRLTPAWLAVSLACCFSASTLAADALQTKADLRGRHDPDEYLAHEGLPGRDP